MHLRLILALTAVMVMCYPAAVFSGTECRATSLESILRQATTYMKKGAARSAVDEWYEPCANSDAFTRGSNQLKERFLFEYVDSCIQASSRPGIKLDTKQRFLEQGIVAARQYIDWYHMLNPEQQAQLSGINQGRIGRIVHNLVEINIEVARRQEVLNVLEEAAEKNPAYISPQSLVRWEEHLKLDSDFKNRLSASEIEKLCEENEEYKLRWELFREFLEKVKIVSGMGLHVRRINAKNRNITCGVIVR